MKRILLKTTIPHVPDDWNIERFSALRDYLRSLKNERGNDRYHVHAHDRILNPAGDDIDLVGLAESDYDQLWLFAVDAGDGLTEKDRDGILAFRNRGGGCMLTRDHQDLGSCICGLGDVGLAHHFHKSNPEPDPDRQKRDDCYTTAIDWPNYHSGRNGDYQEVIAVIPDHPLLQNPKRPDGQIKTLPAHPHEGAVDVPDCAKTYACVVAKGMSKTTGRPFNLIVAFERAKDENGHLLGRAVAQSTFHHFADYNWNPAKGCPSFVEEAPGNSIVKSAEAIEDVHAYVRNLAGWLS